MFEGIISIIANKQQIIAVISFNFLIIAFNILF